MICMVKIQQYGMNIENDIVNIAKNIDMDKFQDGINSLSKAVSLFSDLFANKGTSTTNAYKPRAVYRRFED